MRILIADDHEVVRKGVCNILESRLDVEAPIEARDGKEAVEKARELNPDLVILDVAMPVLDGFSAAERIKKALPSVPILMFSMHDGPEVVQASKLVQAQGFVTKSEDASVLLNAVDALLRGENFFPPGAGLEVVKPSSRESTQE
ncbi:MAG TPA: response regulator transcription factor [Candidatus Acidoferrum sp.]|jgi:DNA-binding NarL/FixJ family response regulator